MILNFDIVLCSDYSQGNFNMSFFLSLRCLWHEGLVRMYYVLTWIKSMDNVDTILLIREW